jgi:cell division protein FtsZ
LRAIAEPGTPIIDMYKKADEVLYYAVRGISDLIVVHGYINVDFADVRAVMSEAGLALMGTAAASGKRRAVEAVQMAIANPLLEDISISGARGVLFNFTGNPENLAFDEFEQASSLIHAEIHEDANIILGQVFDDSIGDEVRVTVIATGIEEDEPVFVDEPEVVMADDSRETETPSTSSSDTGSIYDVSFSDLDYDELDKPLSLRRSVLRGLGGKKR